jgi:two-component system, NtrC family, sensor kinase
MRLLEKFPIPVRRIQGDAKCDFFNKMWLDFTGRTLEQELGDGWAANIHSDDVRAVFQSYLKAFHAHELFELQYRLRRHDGQYRWIVESVAPFEDSEGQFAG